MLAAAEAIARTPAVDRPISCDVSTAGETITVTPDGPDQVQEAVEQAGVEADRRHVRDGEHEGHGERWFRR